MGGKKFVIITIGTGLVLIFSYLFLITQFSWNRSVPSHASAKSWSGGGTGVWENGSNWSPSGVPTSADDVTIDNATVTLTSGQSANFNTLTIGSGSATTLILEGNIGVGGTTTIANLSALTQKNTTQQILSGSLIIQSGGTLNHQFNTTNQDNILNFKAQNITLQNGGLITASQQGYQSGPSSTTGFGPGGGVLGTLGDGAGGGGHGGNGGAGVGVSGGQGAGGTAYCTINNVSTIGSGGGGSLANGNSSGGGLIILEAVDTLTLSGTVEADAQTALPFSASGGGAGGGIKLTAATIAGTPTSISALGGGGDTAGGTSGGGGGGGCIEIRYKLTNSLVSGQLNVTGGTGGNAGANGLKSIAQIPVAAPTGLSTSSILPTAINLNWTPGNGGETSYIVEQSTSGGPFVFVSSVPLTTTTYKFTSLDPNTQYTFRIAGVNGSSTSTYATSSPVYTLAVDISPLTLSNPTTSSLAISFSSTGANPSSTLYALYDAVNAVYLNASGSTSASPSFFTSSSWSGTASGLFSNTTYQFFAVAKNGDGVLTSPTSSLSNPSTSNATTTLTNSPGAPTSPSVSTSSLQLVLHANNNSASTTYAILNITNNQFLTASGTPNETPLYFTISGWGGQVIGLNPGTDYQFVVKTSNGLSSPTSSIFTTLSFSSSSPSGNVGSGGAGQFQFLTPPLTSTTSPSTTPSSTSTTISSSPALPEYCNLTNPDCSNPVCRDLPLCSALTLTNLPPIVVTPPPETIPGPVVLPHPITSSSLNFSLPSSSLPLSHDNVPTLACQEVRLQIPISRTDSSDISRVSILLASSTPTNSSPSSPLSAVLVNNPFSPSSLASSLSETIPSSSISSNSSLALAVSFALSDANQLSSLVSSSDFTSHCSELDFILQGQHTPPLLTSLTELASRLGNKNFGRLPENSLSDLKTLSGFLKEDEDELQARLASTISANCRPLALPLQQSLVLLKGSVDRLQKVISLRTSSPLLHLQTDFSTLLSLQSKISSCVTLSSSDLGTLEHISAFVPSLSSPEFLSSPESARSSLASIATGIPGLIETTNSLFPSRRCQLSSSQIQTVTSTVHDLDINLSNFESVLASPGVPLQTSACFVNYDISLPSTSSPSSSLRDHAIAVGAPDESPSTSQNIPSGSSSPVTASAPVSPETPSALGSSSTFRLQISSTSLALVISQTVSELSDISSLITTSTIKSCSALSEALFPTKNISLSEELSSLNFRLQNQQFGHFPEVSVPSLLHIQSVLETALLEVQKAPSVSSCSHLYGELEQDLSSLNSSVLRLQLLISHLPTSAAARLVSDLQALNSFAHDSTASTRDFYSTAVRCSASLSQPPALSVLPQLQSSLLSTNFLNDPYSIAPLLSSASSSLQEMTQLLASNSVSRGCISLIGSSPAAISLRSILNSLRSDINEFAPTIYEPSIPLSDAQCVPPDLSSQRIDKQLAEISTSSPAIAPLLDSAENCPAPTSTTVVVLQHTNSGYTASIPGLPPETVRSGTVSIQYTDKTTTKIPFVQQTIEPGTVTLDSFPTSGQVVLFSMEGTKITTPAQPNPQLLEHGEYIWNVPNGTYRIGVLLDNGLRYITPPILVRNNLVNRQIALFTPQKVSPVPSRMPVQKISPVTSTLFWSQPVSVSAFVLLGLSVLTLLLLSSLSEIASLLRLILLQPFLLLFADKRQRFGIVYNSLSKQPIDLARVSLYHDTTNKLVQTYITGKDGRFVFQAPVGTYYIAVQKEGMLFPSKILARVKNDGKKTQVYHGEKIVVTKDNPLITPSIPLDPPGEITSRNHLQWRKIGAIAQIVISIIGISLTIVSLVFNPSVWQSWILLALHLSILILFIRLLSRPPRPKGWGIVYDQNKKPLSNSVVRLFNNEYNKLVSSKITDSQGRYFFLAGDSKFKVQFERPGFKTTESKEVDLTGEDSSLITPEAVLKRS